MTMKEFLDSQDFYEVMQEYRLAPFANQTAVVAKFENVKAAILEQLNDA